MLKKLIIFTIIAGKKPANLYRFCIQKNPGVNFSLFESSWKRKYSTRGIHKILVKYAEAAGLSKPISPHQLRHFLLTWLKKQGIDDALIQPYSGHSSRQSLEVYSRLSIGEAQEIYEQAMLKFPV